MCHKENSLINISSVSYKKNNINRPARRNQFCGQIVNRGGKCNIILTMKTENNIEITYEVELN